MKKFARLGFESLEQRLAMAADITAVLAASGVLTITSENGDGTITIDRTATQIRLQETNQSFLVSKVKSIAIDLGDDNDTVNVNSLVARSPWSGTPIAIDTEGGSDRLILNGKSVFFGGGEQDTLTVDKKGNVKIDGAKPDWFDYNVAMDDLGIQARALGVDKVFDRDDMLDLFNTASENDVLGVDDFNSLKSISNNKSYFKGIDWVQGLSSYVVNTNVANAQYQGDPLGNLSAASTGDHLDLLVDKWFLGLDHPETTGSGAEYETVSGNLFDGVPGYTQVHQGAEGDCYFLSSMNAIAAHNPEVIENMFVAYDETEGWYTLRFFDKAKPYYVTIDNMLPVVTATGYLYYDGENMQFDDPDNVLWAAFAEKAYAQLAEFGWTQTTAATNSYASIDGGNAAYVIAQITGQKAEFVYLDKVSEKEIVKAWQKDRPVTFGSKTPSTHNPLIEHDHDYALIGYNAQTKQFLLANPWGVTTHPQPATVVLTWDEITTSFEDVHIGSPV